MGRSYSLARIKSRLAMLLRFLLAGAIFALLVAPEWPPFQSEEHRLDAVLDQRRFDFLVWEIETLMARGEATLTAGQRYLEDDARSELVLDYLDLLARTLRLEFELNQLYADPTVSQPGLEGAELLAEIDKAREILAERQTLVEEIVQEQVAAVLIEEGFSFLGGAWPPVQMRLTPLPTVLIVSPREEIRQIYNIPLQHGMNAAERDEIEDAIAAQLDRSALVDDISGLGFYPAMILETGRPELLFRVVAHEWIHHWLTFKPLGIRVLATQELRTINETVANIAGNEIGRKVLARFYPQLLPDENRSSPAPIPETGDPPPFNFNREMAETRIRVDELLGEGRVEEAEAYMESRRQLFLENGYLIRKLNQAYFAFRGAYADVPGEQGADPIGPSLVALRRASPSIKAFMDRVAPLTSVEALEQLVEDLLG